MGAATRMTHKNGESVGTGKSQCSQLITEWRHAKTTGRRRWRLGKGSLKALSAAAEQGQTAEPEVRHFCLVRSEKYDKPVG
jgi:hypothetical protein